MPPPPSPPSLPSARISLDTEIFTYGLPVESANQQAWLKRDLAAVDRSVTPWVFVYGHKQQWMKSQNVTAINDALHAAGVDLYFTGWVVASAGGCATGGES